MFFSKFQKKIFFAKSCGMKGKKTWSCIRKKKR